MGFAAGSPVHARPWIGAGLRCHPLSLRGQLRCGGDDADYGLSRVTIRAPVRTLRLRAPGDCRGDPTARHKVAAEGRPRPHRSLERAAGGARALPSSGWRGRLDSKRAAAFRRRFCPAPAPALPERVEARAGGGGLMGEMLQVDRIRCDGHGLCAELLPELISLDDWGYPIVKRGPVLALRLASMTAVTLKR